MQQDNNAYNSDGLPQVWDLQLLREVEMTFLHNVGSNFKQKLSRIETPW